MNMGKVYPAFTANKLFNDRGGYMGRPHPNLPCGVISQLFNVSVRVAGGEKTML